MKISNVYITGVYDKIYYIKKFGGYTYQHFTEISLASKPVHFIRLKEFTGEKYSAKQ